MRLVVRTPDELVAAVPQLLGFHPRESLVVIPLSPDLPTVRADLPRTAAEREKVWESVREPFARYARPNSQVGIVCFTADRDAAQEVGRDLAGRLDGLGAITQLTLWTDGQHWCDLTTGITGTMTDAAVDRVAATAVLDGRAQPVASRETLAAAMVGDREPIRVLLPEARAVAAVSNTTVEREWSLAALDRFHLDGDRLTDAAAARMLVALDVPETRDELWNDMTRANSATHVALWHDLTRRAPDEVRAAPATMLGFASWLAGDGARAWCALDQVPAGQRYAMAGILAASLELGVNPKEWDSRREQIRSLAADLDESFVPRADHHDRSGSPAPPQRLDRPGPRR